MRTALPAFLAALSLATASASADDIGPPPADCAPGSIPFSSHAGEWCEDTACATDADCEVHQPHAARLGAERLTCLEVSACVDDASATPGRRRLDSPRGSFMGPGRRVLGACDARGACAEGSCLAARRCVRASQLVAPTPPPPRSPAPTVETPERSAPASSGSAISRGAAPPSTAWLALVALGLLFARRRARSRHARAHSEAKSITSRVRRSPAQLRSVSSATTSVAPARSSRPSKKPIA